MRRQARIRSSPRTCRIGLVLSVGLCLAPSPAFAEQWEIVVGRNALDHRGFQAAFEDLEAAGRPIGIGFSPTTSPSGNVANLIVVGDASRNPTALRLFPEDLKPPTDPQGFRIVTKVRSGGRLLAVVGGSMQGDLYGMYWIWDRLRVERRIPDLNVARSPALPVRLTTGATPAHIRAALRHTATWVAGGSIPDLVPWGDAEIADRNSRSRRELNELIDVAHAYGLKYLAMGDEIAYHPSFFTEFGAETDPADPHLWNAMQAKYRRLFAALPELDGVQIRTGELTRIPDPYIAYDVMHDPRDHSWPLARRYGTFVKKLHEVIVGEFDKIYFHRTWVTNTTEQHSDPSVYRSIFTDEVPTRNLYLSPYLSLGDRWYYQPYNPTFNLTPHAMVALLSTLDYHAARGVPVFPSYPGSYHQGGLQKILRGEPTNLRGVHFSVPADEGWNTVSLTAYTVFRLAWNPDEDLRAIARDFAAIHFGPEAAPALAEVLLLSHEAYRDGIYIKPVAEAIRGNTLPHLRITTFPLRGLPAIDRGRAHIAWLRRSLYEPCLGREEEAIAYLDKGLKAADRMQAIFEEAAPLIEDRIKRKEVGESLILTRELIATNNAYVKACLAYFRYSDRPIAGRRAELVRAVADLKEARARFAAAPGFGYNLYGIDQLLENAEAALSDLSSSLADLDAAPDEAGVAKAIASQQERYARALQVHQNVAVHVMHWRGKVDGRDALRIQGGTLEVKHLQADGISAMEYAFFNSLPTENVTVLIRDNGSREIGPFVLEQPTAANGHAAQIYLFDAPASSGWFDFDVYYVPRSPTELELEVAWQKS